MRVQQRVEALTPRMATAAIENARAQPPSVNTVPIDISEAAADTTPVVVPEKLGHREQADAAADTATETAAKAVIQSGARVAGLGEMCERVALEKRVLGTGAFSVVYRGRISGLGQVAVKRLERQAGDDASAGDFEREVAIMQIPEHPNLLRMLGCANSRTARYLVYPLISGGDLLSYLGSTHPTVPLHGCRLGIAQDVAAGLAALHCHTPIVLHRDLKPQNVLISIEAIGSGPNGGGPNGRPRALLSDFGLSRFAPELRAAPSLTSNHMVGTLGYRAPEIMIGQYSTASDVYSLGVLLLQCVTGRNAIAPGTQANGQSRHLSAWARQARAQKGASLADPRTDFPGPMAESLVSLGLDCCASAAAARPSLDAVRSRLRAGSVSSSGGGPRG